MRGMLRILAALLLIAGTLPARAAEFDFYVLSLSWSPTFCANEPGAKDSAQCDSRRPRGFILHGLWPQFERGYPLDCGSGRLSRRLVDSMLDIMPDAGLVRHEWRRHGTCTGLSPDSYFAAARRAFAAVTLPPDLAGADEARTLSAYDVENAFIAANPGMARDGIAISCRSGAVEEVRICLTRDLAFRACQEVDADGCRQRRLSLPAAE